MVLVTITLVQLVVTLTLVQDALVKVLDQCDTFKHLWALVTESSFPSTVVEGFSNNVSLDQLLSWSH